MGAVADVFVRAEESTVLAICSECRRSVRCARIDGRTYCAKCMGAKRGAQPKRLDPIDLTTVPIALQITVGRIAWRVPFLALRVDKEFAEMETNGSYDGEAPRAAGWTDRGLNHEFIPARRVWRLDAPPASEPPAVLAPEVDADDETLYRLAVGDRITLDEEPAEVMGVNAFGFIWRTIATDARGRSVGEGDCEWSEIEEVSPRVFRVRSVDTETPAQRTKATKPKRAARPARPTPVPDAPEVITGVVARSDAEVELRVVRGTWLQHRSGLQDSAKGMLHKQWLPEGGDRVAVVERGSEAHRKVTAYCTAKGVAVRIDGSELAAPPAKPQARKTSRG